MNYSSDDNDLFYYSCKTKECIDFKKLVRYSNPNDEPKKPSCNSCKVEYEKKIKVPS